LQEALGASVDLVKRRTYQEITALLLSGELDAAWICGFPFVQHRDRLALVVVPLYHRPPLYQSYLIVAQGREVETWQELKGDIHAFSDPDSNSGHLVTWALLAGAGKKKGSSAKRSTLMATGTSCAPSHRASLKAAVSMAMSGMLSPPVIALSPGT
jgi:phosphonate transport system substrate-binding protein